ncbi:hypothetical protein BC831DRAFT_289771 [Entophlyctis helioformis]|nr:hypothetical protein BC831DRAFT_289771 [Entophlyctis helioformis]
MQLPDSASHSEDTLADIAKGDPILAQLIHEASVSLRSLAAVPDALGANLAEHCVACVCYVSDSRFFAAARAAWEHSIDMASCKPPALFVAVQQLPRGALVEWEALVGHERGRAQLMQARVDSSAERDDDDDDNDDEHGESSRGFGWDADGQTVVSDVATGNGVACHSSLKSFGSFIGAATSVSLDHSNDALAFSDVVLLANTLVGGLRSIMSKWQQQTRSRMIPGRVCFPSASSTWRPSLIIGSRRLCKKPYPSTPLITLNLEKHTHRQSPRSPSMPCLASKSWLAFSMHLCLALSCRNRGSLALSRALLC